MSVVDGDGAAEFVLISTCTVFDKIGSSAHFKGLDMSASFTEHESTDILGKIFGFCRSVLQAS